MLLNSATFTGWLWRVQIKHQWELLRLSAFFMRIKSNELLFLFIQQRFIFFDKFLQIWFCIRIECKTIRYEDRESGSFSHILYFSYKLFYPLLFFLIPSVLSFSLFYSLQTRLASHKRRVCARAHIGSCFCLWRRSAVNSENISAPAVLSCVDALTLCQQCYRHVSYEMEKYHAKKVC